jgi:predicted dehydrogenase
MTKLRIGILGASKIAPVAMVAPAKDNPDVAVVAIAARDVQRAQDFAKAHGIARAHDSYAALIADADIDLVYNSLPPKHHLQWTLAALKAGKHVLLEKPSGMSADEAAAMTGAAEKAGRRLIEAYHYRYHPLFARVLEIVSGELGALQTAEAIFEVPIPNVPGEIRYDADLGGGALMDLGCYPVQWLRTIAGEEPEIVGARQVLDRGGADISTHAELRFPAGLSARLSCSMQPIPGKPMAALSINGARGTLKVLNPLAPQFGHLLSWAAHGKAEVQETVSMRATYAYQLDAVVRAITTGASVPTEGADIVATMRAIDAIKAAANTGHRT